MKRTVEVGQQVEFTWQGEPRVGVVSKLRRFDALVRAPQGEYMVPLTLLQPAEGSRWWKVTRVVEFETVVCAPTREAALDWAAEADAKTRLVRERAVPSSPPERAEAAGPR